MALCFASHCSNFSLSLSFAHYPVRECIKYQTRRRNTAPSSLDVVLGRQGKRSHSCKKKKKKSKIHPFTARPSVPLTAPPPPPRAIGLGRSLTHFHLGIDRPINRSIRSPAESVSILQAPSSLLFFFRFIYAAFPSGSFGPDLCLAPLSSPAPLSLDPTQPNSQTHSLAPSFLPTLLKMLLVS